MFCFLARITSWTMLWMSRSCCLSSVYMQMHHILRLLHSIDTREIKRWPFHSKAVQLVWGTCVTKRKISMSITNKTLKPANIRKIHNPTTHFRLFVAFFNFMLTLITSRAKYAFFHVITGELNARNCLLLQMFYIFFYICFLLVFQLCCFSIEQLLVFLLYNFLGDLIFVMIVMYSIT